MDFDETYQLLGFKAYVLLDEEESERNLLHECGHDWIGTMLGAESRGITLASRGAGVSVSSLRRIASLEHYYQIGVAGMLAEAKGIQHCASEGCILDIDRMKQLANALFEYLKAKDPRKDEPLYPDVPMSCRFPSTMWAELSVSDLRVPIERTLNETLLLDALVITSRTFNDEAHWQDFLRHVEQERERHLRRR